jgi:adenosylmethionine-8-amino-7-oxononanoate aminotransferase
MELKYYSPGEQEKTVTRTHGSWVEYSDGRRLLDINCGNMAYILGYNNHNIINAVSENTVNFVRGNTGETSIKNNQLIEEICTLGNWSAITWAVSGSDAVEAAVAMNDTYWHARGEMRHKILSFSNSYHGTTMLAKHLRGYYPELNRAVLVDQPTWLDKQRQLPEEKMCLARIKQKFMQNPDIGCFIIETVNWCGNGAPHSEMFWQTVRKMCTDHDVLMMVDDVAFCWGTNGTMFGYESYGIQPDICAIGKSLTGGYSPLGAAICNAHVSAKLDQHSWGHGHTWQPNMAGVASALEATQQIKSLLHRVPEIEQRLRAIADQLQLSYRGANTYCMYDFGREITMAELHSVGALAASLEGGKSVRVFAPLTADDEFFAELQNGLKRIQLNA